MKKIFLILIIVLVLCGCGNKRNDDVSSFSHASKMDDSKGYIYLEDFHSYKLNDESILVQMVPFINGNTTDANNVNLELKNKVNYNLKKAVFESDMISRLYYCDFITYESDNYFSLIVLNYQYIGLDKSLIDYNAYIFSKNDFSLVNNDELMNEFSLNEDDIFTKVADNIDDSDYGLMMLKSDGYSLIVDEDNKLVIYYIEASDDEIVLKNMVIS